ncbi:hypothetical protein J2X69_000376 [Algoriphagus sp. 4150]|nr:hypothetical protein [Algoriphagus sp. 4150]
MPNGAEGKYSLTTNGLHLEFGISEIHPAQNEPKTTRLYRHSVNKKGGAMRPKRVAQIKPLYPITPPRSSQIARVDWVGFVIPPEYS